MSIVVTGGAGFIGTHCTVLLLEAGYKVIVIDNFSNSSPKSVERVQQITGKSVEVCKLDLREFASIKTFFDERKGEIFAVLHCAALKAVGESVQMPLEYYENNINGSLNLFHAMRDSGCKRIVFSSSATVYGNPRTVPITEDFSICATNPYGRTKFFVEEILRDIAKSDAEWSVINLRYFNPVGAHPSGLIGEDPAGIPNNLMPYISKVVAGVLPKLTIFGNNYDTPDGTGVRDYIHIMDLAAGHVAAIRKLNEVKGEVVVNLGTGRGYSVLELVKAMEAATGREVPYVIGPRREGDIATCYADTSKAASFLGWKATKTVEEMCADVWRWVQNNPKGYRD